MSLSPEKIHAAERKRRSHSIDLFRTRPIRTVLSLFLLLYKPSCGRWKQSARRRPGPSLYLFPGIRERFVRSQIPCPHAIADYCEAVGITVLLVAELLKHRFRSQRFQIVDAS